MWLALVVVHLQAKKRYQDLQQFKWFSRVIWTKSGLYLEILKVRFDVDVGVKRAGEDEKFPPTYLADFYCFLMSIYSYNLCQTCIDNLYTSKQAPNSSFLSRRNLFTPRGTWQSQHSWKSFYCLDHRVYWRLFVEEARLQAQPSWNKMYYHFDHLCVLLSAVEEAHLRTWGGDREEQYFLLPEKES